MTLTPQMIAAMNKVTGNNVPLTGIPPVTSRADEIRALGKSTISTKNTAIKKTEVAREVGADTAVIPATAAPETGLGLKDTFKMIPNAIGDVVNLAKEATYGTAKRILYDIPVAAYNLVKENNMKYLKPTDAVTIPAVTTVKTLWGFVPQAFKELANTNSMEKIPAEFQALAKEKGGYANAFLEMAKSVPESLTPAMNDYVNQIDKARQSVVNHPVNELLGYLGLKQLKTPIKSVTEGAALTKELVTHPIESMKGVGADIKTQTNNLYNAITAKTPAEVDAYITKNFEKGIRPSVGNAKNPIYQDRALNAVKTIVENKTNLKLTDQYGEPVEGVPKNLKQFRDAIDQTKGSIFKQYDAMQKAAGEKGATVPLGDVVTSLREVEANPTITDLYPNVAKYARTRARALENRGEYTPQQAQDAIKSLNSSLDAFYKNPSYETASLATIDAMVANKLRASLDASIENLEGAGYQALKDQYRDLKTIENDVIHRAIVDARKNTKGLLDFADIASGAEAVSGILTMNPGQLAKAGTIAAIKSYYKYINNPNTSIKKLFQAAVRGATVKPTTPELKAPTEGVDLQERMGNSAQVGVGVNSPAMMEARKGFKAQETATNSVKESFKNDEAAVVENLSSEKDIVKATDYPYTPKIESPYAHEVANALMKSNPEITKTKKFKNTMQEVDDAHLDSQGLEIMMKAYPKEMANAIRSMGLDGIEVSTGSVGNKYLLAPPKFVRFRTAERAKNLSPENKAIENKAFEIMEKDPQGLIDEYKKLEGVDGGKIANGDEARRLFGAGSKYDIGYVGTNSQAIQEAVSAIAKEIWDEGLKKEGNAWSYAGGSGSGKTSSVSKLFPDELKQAAVIWDGNLSSTKSMMTKIKEANAAGKVLEIAWVYRNPMKAWVDGVVKRMIENEKEAGRSVPGSVAAGNTVGSYEATKEIIGMLVDGRLTEKNVIMHLVDNSLGSGNQQKMSMTKFMELNYPTVEKLKELYDIETKKLYANGKGGISKEQYKSLLD